MATPIVHTLPTKRGTTIGGDLIEIYGENFQEYSISSTTPAKILFQPVQVLFGGRPAQQITVVNSSRLIVKTPQHPERVVSGILTGVDVTVSNLDSTGTPIVGETTTVANAFIYQYPSTRQPSRLEYIVDTLITLLKESVHPAIIYNRIHTDYDDSVADRLNITKIGKLPHTILLGPTVLQNRFYSDQYVSYTPPNAEGNVRVVKPRQAADLTFQLRIVTDNQQELLRLQQGFIDFFDRTKYFNVPVDITDPNSDIEQYEMDVPPGGDFNMIHSSNNSNIIHAEGMFTLTGVDLSNTEYLETVGTVEIMPWEPCLDGNIQIFGPCPIEPDE